MAVSNTIPVIIITDEHYMVMLAALLKSIELNHKSDERLHVYIVADKVTEKSRRKLRKSLGKDIEISYTEMEDAIPAGIQLPVDRSSFSLIVYMRLFMDSLVPEGTKRAIFIDTDTIVLEDISKLYHTDLQGHIIGAVQDPRLLTFDNGWGGIFNYKELGFDPKTKYFNAGLLLVDVPEWTAQNVAQRVVDCVNNNVKHVNYADQYGLNVVLANQWLQLDPRWNYFASGDLDDPYMIHFISRKPIYTTYAYNKDYKAKFDYYRRQTLWRNAKPIGEWDRYIKKLSNIWGKVKKIFTFVSP